MSDDDRVIVRIQVQPYTDDIWVLIPPKFYNLENLGERIKQAILITQEENKK